MKTLVLLPLWCVCALCFSFKVVQGQPARLSILSSDKMVELEIVGDVEGSYGLEATSDLSREEWDFLAAIRLNGAVERWVDRSPSGMVRRFYRIRPLDEPGPGTAFNFALMDQHDAFRELYYSGRIPGTSGFVLVFTGKGLAELQGELMSELRRLRGVYEPKGLVFWIVDSTPRSGRAAMRQEAGELGIDWTVLHDPAQVVTRTYGVTGTPAVACVETGGWTVFFKGGISGSANAVMDMPLARVEEALERFAAKQPISVYQVGKAENPLPEAPPVPDYSTVIAPLLQTKCVICHSPGNVAPWAMTGHGIVRDYALGMKHEVLAGRMPPWHADREYGVFKNDLSLTPEEKATLVSWIDAGAPRGDGPDPLEIVPPAPPKWPEELGEPDAIITIPPQTIKAHGEEPYRYIFAKTNFGEDRWLRAAVVRPGNKRVVHHYIVWLGESTAPMATGIAGYAPGRTEGPFPPGTGVLLPKNTSLTFNLHYTPSGQEETDQPELGLWFSPELPEKPLQIAPVINIFFTIPPGAMDHPVKAEYTFEKDATIYNLSPHMHFRGKRMKYEAIYPDGQREILLSVPNYHFHWQTVYQLAEPKRVPAGTRILVTGAFDNSELNLHNPDPTETVRWGEQSWEEMFIGFVDYTE